MKGLSVRIGACVLIFALILCAFYYLGFSSKKDRPKYIHLSYFEDVTGEMGIKDIENAVLKSEFIEANDSSLTFGRSHSIFWIRI